MPENSSSKAQRRREALQELVAKTRAEFSESKSDNYIAPFSPSPPELIASVLAHLQLSADDVVMDLGCGDARWLFAAAEAHGCRGVGLEIDPELVRKGQKEARARGLQDLVSLAVQDIAEADLSVATVVVVYAFAKSCERIRDQLAAQVRPGTPIVSVGFQMRGWTPRWQDRVKGLPVYVYEAPGRPRQASSAQPLAETAVSPRSPPPSPSPSPSPQCPHPHSHPHPLEGEDTIPRERLVMAAKCTLVLVAFAGVAMLYRRRRQ